jgi:hypothetical protein
MKRCLVLAGVALMIGLSGCTDGPPTSAPPDLSFANYQPITLDVGQVEVIDNYKPPMKEPYIEHTFRTSPAQATEKLVRHQLAAAGGEKMLRAIIEDASVTHEELPVEKGITGVFMREPAEKLKARVLLRFELVNPAAPDIIIGHADVIAKREKTLQEDVSPAERDHAYFMMTKDLMDDLNDGMRSTVKNTFGGK